MNRACLAALSLISILGEPLCGAVSGSGYIDLVGTTPTLTVTPSRYTGQTFYFWYPTNVAFRGGQDSDDYYPSQITSSVPWGSFGFGVDQGPIGSYSTAFGWLTSAPGQYAFSAGSVMSANGTGSVALGYGGEANGYASVAIGSSVATNGMYSVALGRGIETANPYEVVVGCNNDTDWWWLHWYFDEDEDVDFNASPAIFRVGDGGRSYGDGLTTPGNHDAFAVYVGGTTRVAQDLIVQRDLHVTGSARVGSPGGGISMGVFTAQ